MQMPRLFGSGGFLKGVSSFETGADSPVTERWHCSCGDFGRIAGGDEMCLQTEQGGHVMYRKTTQQGEEEMPRKSGKSERELSTPGETNVLSAAMLKVALMK